MMKSRCREDLELFAEYYFNDFCRLPWNRLHEYIFRRRKEKTSALPPDRRGSIDVVLAPRGAAKSTMVSLVFPLHALLYRTEHYIILISATERQAVGRLANIRDVLAANERLNKAFGRELARTALGSRRSIVVNRVKIDAFSAGSELRGLTHGAWRPTWVVLDDVESSARVFNSIYRQTLNEWMNEVVENLGNGYTNIDLIGTLLHTDALPNRLAERPDVRMRKFKSILAEADRQDLWEQWSARLFDLANPGRLADAREFFRDRREAMLAGAEVLWPEKESYEELQLMRATRGRAAFNKEKQNEPPEEGEAIFPRSMMRWFKRQGDRLVRAADARFDQAAGAPEAPMSGLRIFGFLDPAMGEVGGARGRSRRGDFAAIVTVGIDPHGYLYVLDAWLERTSPSAQINRIFDLHERWRYVEFGIETNAFQKFMLEPLERERRRRNRAGGASNLPVRGVRSRINKKLRIMSLEPLMRSGWVLFSEDLNEELIRQLTEFPHARHDDGPDALQAAIALARGARSKLECAAPTRRRGQGRVRSY